jgi:hypothetical protein
VTPAAETTTEATSSNETSSNNAGWASFDTADFGPPSGSSSPSQAKMETDDKSHEIGNGDNQRSDSSKSS